jgi:predicted  nucleic acid-binding Zn-ribbon protein
LKDQLRLLQELQTVDSRAVEVKKQMTALPERLEPARQDLAKLEALLDKARSELASTENWRKDQEEQIKRDEDAVRAARAKLQQSRNTRDFGAANREVENKRRSVSEREEEVLKVTTAMETNRATIENSEKDVAALRERLAAEEAEVAGKVAELAVEANAFEAERSAIATKLPAELLRRYETVQKRRGLALVPVDGGICQGCYMSLPPQLNNIIARMTSLESCPNCQRLLYRPEMLAATEPGAANNA